MKRDISQERNAYYSNQYAKNVQNGDIRPFSIYDSPSIYNLFKRTGNTLIGLRGYVW